jgi:hypothetical protein
MNGGFEISPNPCAPLPLPRVDGALSSRYRYLSNILSSTLWPRRCWCLLHFFIRIGDETDVVTLHSVYTMHDLLPHFIVLLGAATLASGRSHGMAFLA